VQLPDDLGRWERPSDCLQRFEFCLYKHTLSVTFIINNIVFVFRIILSHKNCRHYVWSQKFYKFNWQLLCVNVSVSGGPNTPSIGLIKLTCIIDLIRCYEIGQFHHRSFLVEFRIYINICSMDLFIKGDTQTTVT
jgi:hypothetical protein